MKKILLLALFTFATACSQQKEFSKESLSSTLKDNQNQDITFEQILEKHKGKKILIDVWASWCGDCIKAMPDVKKIKAEQKDIVFINLSCDKTYESWLKGMERFEVGGENYLIPGGMKGAFGTSISLGWIPRYILVNADGSVFQFKATEPSGIKLQEFLKQ